MRHLHTCFALLLSALLLGACAQPPGADDTDVGYLCESGALIVVSYPDADSAVIRYEGQKYELKIAVSASGSRYVGETLEWWPKGSGGGASASLSELLPDGTSGELIESCKEAPPARRRPAWVSAPSPNIQNLSNG